MTLRLTSGPAEALLDPDRGGAVAALAAGGRPVLSTGAGRPGDSPFALAMNLLLPFSNRISGPFAFEGRRHALAPNLDGEPFPIHGDAFQRPWIVVRHDAASATLRLPRGAFGPYAYEAEVAYRLSPDRLEAALRLTSTAAVALPYGLGFHPWFPRGPATRLRFRATGRWPEGERHLPATDAPVPLGPGRDWSDPAPPPAGWINEGFSGWDGTADLLQGEDAASLRLSASGLSTLLVHSPSAEAPFLCLEPVSHPVDAHCRPGQPGLVRLDPGGSVTASLALDWGPAATTAPAPEIEVLP